MKETMFKLAERKREIEKNILPFVEPNSLAEELAFNELFYVTKQIGIIAKGVR